MKPILKKIETLGGEPFREHSQSYQQQKPLILQFWVGHCALWFIQKLQVFYLYTQNFQLNL